MFEKYLENRNQSALIGFFLASPERAFYYGEIQKRTGLRSLDLLLLSFVREGFLTTFSKKSKKYYRVNQNSPVYLELKFSIGKNFKGYEDELSKYLRKIPGIKAAVLSGIFVGQPQMECDLVLAGKMPIVKLEELEKGLTKLMGQEVNYAVFSVEEYKYRKSIFDRFMKDIFENDHLVLFDKTK